MSKSQLKKLLATMTAEQISEVLLDLYAARREAKEYLDFFVQPNLSEKMEKAKKGITKEMLRTVKRYARPRMTKIRQIISDLKSLNPGSEPVAEIMTFSIEEICRIGTHRYLLETTRRNASKLLIDTLMYIDRAGLFSVYLPRLSNAVAGMDTTDYYCGSFGRLMRDTLQDWFASDTND